MHGQEFITALTIANMEFVNKPPVYTNVEKDLSQEALWKQSKLIHSNQKM